MQRSFALGWLELTKVDCSLALERGFARRSLWKLGQEVDMMSSPENRPKTAQIISPLLGRIIGGLVAERHEDGEVTILFAGLRKKGQPLSHQDVLKIEMEASKNE